MTAVKTVSATSDAKINALLSGIKWDSLTLSYSFPTSNVGYASYYGKNEPFSNFGALNPAQIAAVNNALSLVSAVTNLTFVLQTESVTQHADLRFATSSVPPTAWAYYPSTTEIGGDIWFGNSSTTYASPSRGNYAYYTVIHELGHALGLKHPHEGGGLGTLSPSEDSMEYSLMSYRSHENASTSSVLTNERWGFAQTLMMYDIAALQHMYGADYTTNATDTVYSWSRTTGQMTVNGIGQGSAGANRIFMTLWDGGGTDTYDFSSYTATVSIDLQPGRWTITSPGQRAVLGGSNLADGNVASALLHNNDTRSLIENATGGSGADVIVGNQASNVLQGGAGDDLLDGRQGNDVLIGGGGNDRISGGFGNDVMIYNGASSSFSWSRDASGAWTVRDLRAGGPEGRDLLDGIEVLRFSNGEIILQAAETPPPEPPAGPFATAVELQQLIRSILRVEVPTGELIDDAGSIGTVQELETYIAQLVARAQDSTIPALIVYDYIQGATPGDSHLDSLAAFVSSQIFSFGYQMTANPRLGGSEAMGLGLSETSSFTASFGLLSDDAFLAKVYADAFATTIDASRMTHFSAQLAYFEKLYVDAGISEQVAEGRARGAVLGQMFGNAAADPNNLHAMAAEDFLHDLATGQTTTGMPLIGQGHLHGQGADGHLHCC